MSKQISLLKVSGVALGAGLIAFLLFYAIFGIRLLAIIVGVATGLFFVIIGALLLVSISSREGYRRELERVQRMRTRQFQEEEAYVRGGFFRGRIWRQEGQEGQERGRPRVIESSLAQAPPADDARKVDDEREEEQVLPPPAKRPRRPKGQERARPGDSHSRPAGQKGKSLPLLQLFKRKARGKGKKQKNAQA